MIQSVERAFKLLYTIGLNSDQNNISQLARDVNLPRTTVVRLLDTLQEVGAIKTADFADEYQIGDKLLALLSNTPWIDQIAAITQPYAQQLAAQTGETTYVGVPDGNHALYITQINSRHTIQMQDWTGQRGPLHATSVGKLFLAYRSPQAQKAYLRQKLEAHTIYTLTTAEQLRPELLTIRQTGIGWAREELEIGYIGLSAPIFNQQNKLTAAIALGLPKFRIENRKQEEHLVTLLKETADQITQHLQSG